MTEGAEGPPEGAEVPAAPSDPDSSRELYERDALALAPVFGVLLAQDDLLVINKPQDVRLDGDHPITVERYVASAHPQYAAPGLKLRFIHQLDYATSGILCLGFTRKATGRLSRCFEDRTTKKYYLAVVYGAPALNQEHRLEWALADDPTDERKFRMCVGTAANPGRASATVATVLAVGHYRGQQVSKVLLQPLTGRRHQLRVHCREWGHPIVGDCTYARDDPHIPRMMLHAWRLRLPLPIPGALPDATGGSWFVTPDPFTEILATDATALLPPDALSAV